MTKDYLDNPRLLEALAAQEHERWSGWMRYQCTHMTLDNVFRWFMQMNIPYSDLPEHSKESDRKEARKTLALLKEALNHDR